MRNSGQDFAKFFDLSFQKGTLITLPFYDYEKSQYYFDTNDYEEFNKDINEKKIFISPEQEGGRGGAGGPVIPPETMETLSVIINTIMIDIFAAFAYDALKEAIKRIMRKWREKRPEKKSNSFEIRHNKKSVIIIMREDEVDEELLDLTLRALLANTTLEESEVG